MAFSVDKFGCMFCGVSSVIKIFTRIQRSTEEMQVLAVACPQHSERIIPIMKELDEHTSWHYCIFLLTKQEVEDFDQEVISAIEDFRVVFHGKGFAEIEEWALRELGA